MPPPSATKTVQKTYQTFREIHGVVVSAGLIDKTVKVLVGGQRWNKFIKKVCYQDKKKKKKIL